MTATKNLTRNMCTDGPEGGWENSVTTSPDPDSTYVEITTGAYTVINGNTMYEGNVYLSLSDPWVRDNCYNTVKPQTVKPRIVTMASSDVFSVRGYPHNVIPYSMNYADFIEPVPWSAYLGGRYCYANRVACTQVFPGDYYPVIRMPGQIRHLDPNWASCEFTEFPLFDPPIALTAVPNFLTSSTPADPTPTSAEPVVTATPGQSSNDESPPVTSTPKPTSRPADPEDPVSSPTLQDPPPSQTQSPEDPEPGETQTPSDPQEPVPSNGNTPNPQEPIPSNGNTPDPQQPLPSNGNNPDPQEPLPSNGNTPDPQEPVPSNNPDPQNPTPSNPQIPDPVNPSPGDPGESGPGNPNTRDPIAPSEPGADPSATSSPNDPQNPSSPSNSPNPVPGEDVTEGPGGNPTAGLGNNPTAGPGSNPTAGPGSNPGNSPGNNPGNIPGNNGQSNPAAPVITVGPTVIPVDPTGGLIINPGTTLTNGGAPVVISSTTFSIGTGGLTIVSPETSTEVQFGDSPVTVPVGPSGVPIVLDPSASTVVIGGTTLSQGGDPVTVGDSTLSVGPSGIVIAGPSGTSTIDIPVATTTGTSTSAGTEEIPSGQVEFGGAAVQIVGNHALTMGMVALWLAVI
ncbi:hypothetical protein GRF29_8g2770388 [Pseudopithomyces chartarum]|uniref:Uncharacterized protein n=1 Tax=Pseudopithomyces chartarum TaxID=1892770 RepID=A0AAN6RMP4_9PLEO|nr:hypothetical protein GRF29_8g2770388 [Pseudopithomyces chartarum]